MVKDSVSVRLLPVIGLSVCGWIQSRKLNQRETRLTGYRCLMSMNNALFINR